MCAAKSTPASLSPSLVSSLSCMNISAYTASHKELQVTALALESLSPHPQKLDYIQATYALSLNGKYRLTMVLGAGQFGVVLKALNPEGSEVAIKISRTRIYNTSLRKESDALEDVNRLAPDLTVQKIELQEHLNLSDCCDERYCKELCCNDKTALVTTYGGTNVYKTYVAPAIKMPASRFIDIARSCMTFWSRLYAEGSVLRDIKSENMVIDSQETLRFIDFGMYGKQGAACRDQPARFFTSPGVLKECLDHSEMPFSFACTLFEILTGQVLFESPRVETESPSKFYENLRMHLTYVFALTREPSQSFISSLNPPMRALFFKQDSSSVFHPIPASCATARLLTAETVYQEIGDAIDPKNDACRIILEDIDPKSFRKNFMGLLLKLLNFENPLKPEEALAHPFFKLKQGPQ